MSTKHESKGNSMRFRCNCGGKIYVQETRACADVIYRIRKCFDCKELFTTKEEVIEGFIPREAVTQRKTK